MRPIKTTLLCLTVLSVLASCAQTKQLGEMHDSTAQMNKTTESMDGKMGDMNKRMESLEQKMGGMKDTTDGLRADIGDMRELTRQMAKTTGEVLKVSSLMGNTTNELLDVSKQGGAASIRREAFERMLGSASLGKKVDQAAQYYMAYEFQLWSGIGQDDAERRVQLMNDASLEFFKAVQEVMEFTAVLDGSLDINPLAGQTFKGRNTEDNHAATLNALAAAMHLVNRKQLYALKNHPEMKPVSIYSMIQKALRVEKDLNAGRISSAQIPIYVQQILENRDIAVKLLQARYNVCMAIVLEKTRPKGGLNLQAYYAASKASIIGRMIKIPWKLEMDRFNVIQLQDYTDYLDWAAETRDFLHSIGETPSLNVAVGSMIHSMQIVSRPQPSAYEVDAQVKFQDAINRIKTGQPLKEMPSALAPSPRAVTVLDVGAGGVEAAPTAAAPGASQARPLHGRARFRAHLAEQHRREEAAQAANPGATSDVGSTVAAPAPAKPGMLARLKARLSRLLHRGQSTAPAAPAAAAPPAETPAPAAPAAVVPAAPAPSDATAAPAAAPAQDQTGTAAAAQTGGETATTTASTGATGQAQAAAPAAAAAPEQAPVEKPGVIRRLWNGVKGLFSSTPKQPLDPELKAQLLQPAPM